GLAGTSAQDVHDMGRLRRVRGELKGINRSRKARGLHHPVGGHNEDPRTPDPQDTMRDDRYRRRHSFSANRWKMTAKMSQRLRVRLPSKSGHSNIELLNLSGAMGGKMLD